MHRNLKSIALGMFEYTPNFDSFAPDAIHDALINDAAESSNFLADDLATDVVILSTRPS